MQVSTLWQLFRRYYIQEGFNKRYMNQSSKRRLELLGVPVDVFSSLVDLKEYAATLLHNGQSNQVVFLNYKLLRKARHTPHMLQMLEDAALVLPAEPSIVKGLSFIYKETFTAYAPFDVVIGLLSTLENSPNKSAYLLGGNKKTLTRVYHNLKGSYPKLLFVGHHQGIMKADQEKQVVEAIRKASPSILLTSRRLAKQDRWLYHYRKEFKPGITIYSRDCFDVFVGKKKRPAQRELQLKKGFKLSRTLSYPLYGFMLLLNRVRMKALRNE
jgi:N-acetylglucosaminyldiphosphoundecaprenol N-acetyl-beta-D-mannosaminyltransferase